MKTTQFLFGMTCLAAMTALNACSSDEDAFVTDASRSKVISLTSSLNATRATTDPQTTALNTSNIVGVFVTDGTAVITNGNNNQHTVAADGALTTSNVMNYPAEDGTAVNIYAYAPYAESMTLDGDNNFAVASDQSDEAGYLNSDLLYAAKENQEASEAAVSLTFSHKLSKLNIIVNNADDSGIDLTNAAVYVTGTKTATTFNPSTGAIGEASGDASNIKAVAALGTGTTACAIVVPQTVAAGAALVKIVAGDKTLVAKLASEVTFASGSAYNFTVSISKADVVLTLTSTSITAWNDVTLDGALMEEESTEVVSPLYASFGTPGSNASYEAPTYTWTGSTSNLMTVFEFANGELANYSTLTFTFSSLVDGPVRMGYYVGSAFTEIGNGYYSAGTKTVDLTTLGIDLSTVTRIAFGGRSNAGSCEILANEVYLTK